MVVLSFTAINSQSHYGEHSYFSLTSEQCFDLLSELVSRGWQLLTVHYGEMSDGYLTWIELPIDAFDGEPIQEPLGVLKQEWEQILS